MNIQEFLAKTQYVNEVGDYILDDIRPRVHCVDGFTMSVQASRHHYSDPRSNDGPYMEVEVGFPSSAEDLLTPYAEDADDLTGTVYGFVPIEIVQRVIDKHGGFAPSMSMLSVELNTM